MDINAALLLWNMPFLLISNYQINYQKKQKLKNISDRHIQTSRISLWISTMVTKKAHYLFMQQCMMGAMN